MVCRHCIAIVRIRDEGRALSINYKKIQLYAQAVKVEYGKVHNICIRPEYQVTYSMLGRQPHNHNVPVPEVCFLGRNIPQQARRPFQLLSAGTSNASLAVDANQPFSTTVVSLRERSRDHPTKMA